VIPELTIGANTLLFTAWCDFFSNLPAIYRARTDDVPRAWCVRRLGIPLPRPRLGTFAKDTMPVWTHNSILAFEDVPRIGADE
jgi:hypothetical protein